MVLGADMYTIRTKKIDDIEIITNVDTLKIDPEATKKAVALAMKDAEETAAVKNAAQVLREHKSLWKKHMRKR